MPDPLAPLVFPKVYQDTDPAIVETFNIPGTTYVLGSGLSPAYPSGASLIPKGAGPYANLAAPTAGPTYAAGGLVDNGNYIWAMSLVTDWGETQPTGTLHVAAIGSGKRGQTLNLPGYTGRADNPPRKIRIWRTTSGGSQLYLVAELEDLSVNEYVDEIDDSELTITAPTSNTSGMIGIGAVDVYDGAIHWTEVALGTTLTTKHFSVDYTITATGGTVHFAGADNGVNVTVTYFAGTFLGSTYLNQYWTALAGVWEWARVDATAVFSHGLQITEDLEVLGNTDLDGTLDVASTSTFNALLTTSSLHVTGTSVLDGVVTMGSNATVAGTLDVTGNATFHGTLDVTGAATFGSTLNVTGLATLSGGMSTTGGGSFTGNVSVGGTLTVTGGTTLNSATTITAGGLAINAGGLVVTAGGFSLVAGGFGLAGGGTISGATTFPDLVTMGGGLHITGGPPDFQVANIFGSGGSLVTIGHSTNHQDFSVTGTSTLNGDTDLGGVLKVGTILEHSGGAKTTFTTEVVTNTWINLFKIKAAGGTPGLSAGVGPGAATLAFTGSIHTDFAGLIHYVPNGSPTSGDQFQVTYSGGGAVGHSANPMVLISLMTASATNAVQFYVSSSADLSFIVAAKSAPAAGVDYYIGYMVIN